MAQVVSIDSAKILNAAECANFAQIMNLKYGSFLKGRTFSMEAQELPLDQLRVAVILSSLDHSFYYPIETQVSLVDREISKKQACAILVDFIDTYFSEFFEESERIYLPIDWTEYTLQGLSFGVRGQILNKHLEKLADELLGTDFHDA